MNDVLIVALPAAEELAEALAERLRCTANPVQVHRFPDGESGVRLPTAVDGKRVVFAAQLERPDEKTLPLLFAADAARELGAAQRILVAPYLPYMRQDERFRPGDAISSRSYANLLSGAFDALLTVDPHLHRVATLQEAIPVRDAMVLDGAPLLSDHIATQCTADVLLIGPDEESLQWVAQAARRHGWEHGVCRKTRHGDREVDIELPTLAVRGRAVVLMDDVASSGHTLARAAALLREAGAASVDVAVTHALFAEGAVALIREAGVDRLWSTDCIPHPSNAVSIVPAVAARLRGL